MPLFNSTQVTRGLLSNHTDSKNFHIDKQGRFGARFFQAVVAVGSWFFLGNQNQKLLEKKELDGILKFNWFLAVASPAIAAGLVALYMVPWFKKSWTSLKTLIVETTFDAATFVLWTVVFAIEVTKGGGCPPGATATTEDPWLAGCDRFNWVLAWGAFSMIFWFAGLCFDIWSYLKGAHGYGESLSDGEADSVLRRLSKMPVGRR